MGSIHRGQEPVKDLTKLRWNTLNGHLSHEQTKSPCYAASGLLYVHRWTIEP